MPTAPTTPDDPTSPAGLWLEHDDPAVVSLELADGRAVLCSRPGPGKAANEDGAAMLRRGAGAVLAVADGMGGQSSGVSATRVALEAIAARMNAAEDDEARLRSDLVDGIEDANRAVLGLGVGAGVTLAAVVLRDGLARTVHVGDSMALHVGQRGRVKALTIPHSPTGYAVEAGLLEAEDALHHEELHVVSNYLGFEGLRIELGPTTPVAARDTLLLCSDGLSDNLRLEEIIELVRKGPLELAARRLMDLASARMNTPEDGHPSKPDDLTLLLYRRSSVRARK
ncbi:MAG: serine/threonine-protein phosphatase [Planctomycetota bacterium]|nr:serine/threonine-protein phosphatase [Planctomycetota bacterium]